MIMKYSIKTEDFSSRFVVFDSEDLERYFVKNEMDSIMRKLTIFDLADNIVCTVEKKFFTLRPTYVILNKHNQPVIHIRKKFNLLRPQFTITSELEETKFLIIGDYPGENFTIMSKDEKETLAKVIRNGGYNIEILDDEYIKMTFSDEAIKYGKETIQHLLETQCRMTIRPTLPITFYYKQSDNLIDEADFFYKTNQIDRSFILYSRYITLFVETLKSYHPEFANAPVSERERVKAIIRSKALTRAEELKKKLIDQYAAIYDAQQKKIKESENVLSSTTASVNPSVNIHNENEQTLQQLKSNYAQIPPAHVARFVVPPTDNGVVQTTKETIKPNIDRSQKPVFNLFRPIRIPNDITPKFLQVAQRNTEQKIETCGILAGIRKDNQYVITHIVVPKQHGGPDSCETVKEEEMVEYISNHDLITLGWIHTHPTQTSFCSSVDLHTHLPYQMLLQEAIAIVISPKYNETGIFSLTSDVGISVISACTKAGFHEHVNNPPLYVCSSHTSYDPSLSCQIVDLRN